MITEDYGYNRSAALRLKNEFAGAAAEDK